VTIAGYLYEVERESDLPRLIRAFEKSLTRMAGSPLRPVSSVSAVIDLDSYKDAMSGNAAALSKLEARLRVRKQTIDEQRMLALMVARESRDLPDRQLKRVARKGPAATGGPYDWHLLETRTVEAWKLFQDAHGGIPWNGIRVGQIDTGYTEHEGLGFIGSTSAWVDTFDDYNYMAEHGGQFTEAGSNFPFNESPETAIDPLSGVHGGHGTKTNSVLSGYSDVANYRGAAPQIPVVPIRLTDIVWIEHLLATDLPSAIMRLVDKVGVRLITLSMGAPYHDWTPKALSRAINHAYERGVFVFCAAGNNIPVPDVVTPACLERTIAVGGTTRDRMPWTGSSRGPEVEISAPADPIHRAERKRDGTDAYGVGDGTSYATPQVCAAAALWLAWHGGAIAANYPEPWQPIEAFRELLADTAAPLAGDPNFWKGKWGAGLLDTEALLLAPLPAASSLRKSAEA
jgi:hypothetical protein